MFTRFLGFGLFRKLFRVYMKTPDVLKLLLKVLVLCDPKSPVWGLGFRV